MDIVQSMHVYVCCCVRSSFGFIHWRNTTRINMSNTVLLVVVVGSTECWLYILYVYEYTGIGCMWPNVTILLVLLLSIQMWFSFYFIRLLARTYAAPFYFSFIVYVYHSILFPCYRYMVLKQSESDLSTLFVPFSLFTLHSILSALLPPCLSLSLSLLRDSLSKPLIFLTFLTSSALLTSTPSLCLTSLVHPSTIIIQKPFLSMKQDMELSTEIFNITSSHRLHFFKKEIHKVTERSL